MLRKLLLAAVVMVALQVQAKADPADYTPYLGVTETQGVVIPPSRYLHDPDSPPSIQEKSSREIQSLCRSETTDACLATVTKRRARLYTEAKACVENGAMTECRETKADLGDVISVTQTIFVPAVGERFGSVVVTQAMQAALVIHEIGHLNGWPSTHPRH